MTLATVDALGELAAAAAELRLDEVPEPVVVRAEELVADTIAVAAAGARRGEHRALVEARAEPADAAPANVVAAGRWRAATPIAALLNGTAAIALELDESLVGGGHPAAHVVPAALAVAQERDRSGAELVAAVLAGYEVAARLHQAHRMTYPAHPHGLMGSVGAAVACARLRGSDPAAAASVAATIGPVAAWSACFEGATARNAWTGLGALAGVVACDLAEAGSAGAQGAPGELLELLAAPGDPEALSRPLDPEALLVTRSATRVYAVASPLHPAVEAAHQLAAGRERDIAAVHVETVEQALKFARPPRPNDLSARFSLPHAVAAALLADVLEPAAFAYDDAVAALAERVRVSVAADLQERWPARVGARVTVRDAEGVRTASCAEPLGHPDRPLDRAAFARRLEALAGPAGPALVALRERPSVADVLEGLR